MTASISLQMRVVKMSFLWRVPRLRKGEAHSQLGRAQSRTATVIIRGGSGFWIWCRLGEVFQTWTTGRRAQDTQLTWHHLIFLTEDLKVVSGEREGWACLRWLQPPPPLTQMRSRKWIDGYQDGSEWLFGCVYKIILHYSEGSKTVLYYLH